MCRCVLTHINEGVHSFATFERPLLFYLNVEEFTQVGYPFQPKMDVYQDA